MIDELRAIAIFAETVRQGSFRGAAKVLGLSPSVISHHVSALEKKVGNALIYRSTRKLSLTNEGEALYCHAIKMLEHAQTGLSKATPNRFEPMGKLTLSIPLVLSRSLFSQKIAHFVQQYPKLELVINSTDERQNIIEDGIDLAIRAGNMDDSNLKSKHIGYIQKKLVCSARYFNQQPTPKSPEDLSAWHWIKLAMLPNTRSLIDTEGEKISITYTSHVTVNSVDLMTEFCINGLGLATPPDFLVNKAIETGELIEVFPGWKVEPISLYAVWPGNVSLNSNARIFLDYLSIVLKI